MIPNAIETGHIPNVVVVCDPEHMGLSGILEMIGPERPVNVRIYSEDPSNPAGRNKLESVARSARAANTLYLQQELLLRSSPLAQRAIIATWCDPDWQGNEVIFNGRYQNVTLGDDGVGG